MDRLITWRNLLSLIAAIGLIFSVLSGTTIAAAEVAGDVDLAIEMKAPQFAEPGGTYVVHVAYTNYGMTDSPADTWVKVTLPDGSGYVSAKDRDGYPLPPDTIVGNVLTWEVGAVTPDACCNPILITIAVDETLLEGTALTSLGELGSTAVDSDPANNTFSITTTVSDLAGSTKQAQVSKAKPGDVIAYTITIRLHSRIGQTDAAQERDVELVDLLPPATQMRFMGWDGENAGTYDGTQLKWQGRIRAGEAITLQYRLGIEGDVPAGTLVRNRARLNWQDGTMEMEPVDVEVVMTENDHMFGPQGGQWQHKSGLTIDVPANAVQAMTRFEFGPLFEDTPPSEPAAGWKFAHKAFELNAFQFGELHQFGEQLTLTIRYQGQDVQGIDPNTLRLWYRSGPGEPWTMSGEPQMHQNGQISFMTDHFTEFTLFGQGLLPHRISLPIIIR